MKVAVVTHLSSQLCLMLLLTTWVVGFSGCTPAPSAPAPASPFISPLAVPAKVDRSPKQETHSAIAASLRPSSAKTVSRKISTKVRLTDCAAEVGLNYTYENGERGLRLMCEATGGGCGWIDFDRDGWCDLYLPQGGNPAEPAGPQQPADALYRSLGGEQFVEVAALAGIDERGYGQGIAVGDFDDDGFEDLYVTNVGPNTFLQNQGDGTFREIAGELKMAGNLWSSSAAWADIDLDGDLDLYVCNYVAFDPLHPRICHNAKGEPAMCHPNVMEAVPDECYINQGDGTFKASAQALGLHGEGNKALGVVIADFTGDRWPDIFVANDTCPNFLFVSQEGQHFVESAMLMGCAVSSEGLPQANMGIAVGDYDRNGFLDLVVTHFVNEWATLYQNLGPNGFHDVSTRIGLAAATKNKLGFGTIMADLDLDGQQEVFVANGHIDDLREKGDELEMTPQLFAFDGQRWHECGSQAGAYFTSKFVGRGVATADFDGDGDLDVAVGNQNSRLVLLKNESERGRGLQIELNGRRSNRRGIGARVTVKTPELAQSGEMIGGSSYCAAHETIVSFGLRDYAGPLTVEIHWPSGIEQQLTNVTSSGRLRIVEPEGPPAGSSNISPASPAP